MDVPVGVQIIVFSIYVAWSVGSLVLLSLIVDKLDEIKKEIHEGKFYENADPPAGPD